MLLFVVACTTVACTTVAPATNTAHNTSTTLPSLPQSPPRGPLLGWTPFTKAANPKGWPSPLATFPATPKKKRRRRKRPVPPTCKEKPECARGSTAAAPTPILSCIAHPRPHEGPGPCLWRGAIAVSSPPPQQPPAHPHPARATQRVATAEYARLILRRRLGRSRRCTGRTRGGLRVPRIGPSCTGAHGSRAWPV